MSKGVEVNIIVATSDSKSTFHGAKTIYVEGGPTNKRNQAYYVSKSDYIAFFDDDIEATPTAVYEMLKVLVQDQVGMVFGKLRNMEFRDRFDEAGSYLTGTGFLWSRAQSGIKDVGQYDTVEPVLAGKSASCMIRRDVFAKVGFFDNSYEILGEETDLAWRVWLAGYKVLYVPKSVTYHAFNTKWKPPDMYTPKRVYYNGCRNYLTMLYTNLGKKVWIIPLLTQLTVWSSAGFGMLITGKFSAGLHIFRGIAYFFVHIRQIWRKRFIVQRLIRRISDKELFPIIVRNPSISYYIKRFFHYIKTGRHG